MKSQYKKIGLLSCLVVGGVCTERSYAREQDALRVPMIQNESAHKRNAIDNIKDRYSVLEDKLKQFEENIDKTSGRQKRNLQSEWNKLDKERAKLNEQIESLANVQEDKWNSVMAKVEKEIATLDKKLDNAIR